MILVFLALIVIYFAVHLTKLVVPLVGLMRGSIKFCQRGSNFLVDEGIDDPNTTKSGPPSARQRNAILMAFCWRVDDGQH